MGFYRYAHVSEKNFRDISIKKEEKNIRQKFCLED